MKIFLFEYNLGNNSKVKPLIAAIPKANLHSEKK